jgi:Cof subfamily protein (haloacid dehalogenase superfamily)
MNIVPLNKEKHLIIVDLDGTILNKDFATLNPENKATLQKLKAQGHKICIATGRNYLSALPFYKEIGLDTFLITYNGAYIIHPLEKNALPLKAVRIANATIRSILAEKVIKNNLLNVMVDTIDLQTVSTSDDVYYQQIFFNGNPYIKVEKDILEYLRGKDGLQLVLEFPYQELEKVNKIFSALRKYHESTSFYFGGKMKAEKEGDTILVSDPTKLIVKIRSAEANKFRAAESMSKYYNIPLKGRTIAFGNDTNDVEMLTGVGVGVAISNSAIDLKAFAHDITEFDSHSGGVAKYLRKYFQV